MTYEQKTPALKAHFLSSGRYTPVTGYQFQEIILPKPNVANSLVRFPTDIQKVQRIISSLINTAAAGCDLLKTFPIAYFGDIISRPLAHIINTMLEPGISPDDPKIATLGRAQKGGRDNTVNNSRPIFVLPVLSKLFKRVISVRLAEFVDEYKVLSDAKHGFRKNKSPEQALLMTKHEITSNVEQKLRTLGFF